MATPNHGYTNLSTASTAWKDNFTAIDVDMPLRGLDGDRPAAGTAGRLYITTNTDRVYYDDGASWSTILKSGASAQYSDDGTGVISGPSDINFTNQLNVVDDGDGTATIAVEDGSGSGLDADTIDALESTQFLRSDVDDTWKSAALTLEGPDDAAGSITIQPGADTTTTGTPSISLDVQGDIVDNTTTIWDSANGYIPSSVVQKSGLDAETIDSLDSTQFLRSDADDTWKSAALTLEGPDDAAGSITIQPGADTSTSGTPSISLDVRGDIVDNTTTVWDSTNGYIPSSVVQKSGLDADTLDTLDSTQLLRSDADDTWKSSALTLEGPDDAAGSITIQPGADTATTGTPSISLDVRGDIVDNTTTIWDSSAGVVPDAAIDSTITRDTELSSHTGDTTNPHSVTAAQAGAVATSGDTMTGELTLPGNVKVGGDANGAIELGDSTSTTDTPFIDFHYGVGSAQDYNVRIHNDANNQLSIVGGVLNATSGVKFNGGASQSRPVVVSSTAPSDTNAIWIDTS